MDHRSILFYWFIFSPELLKSVFHVALFRVLLPHPSSRKHSLPNLRTNIKTHTTAVGHLGPSRRFLLQRSPPSRLLLWPESKLLRRRPPGKTTVPMLAETVIYKRMKERAPADNDDNGGGYKQLRCLLYGISSRENGRGVFSFLLLVGEMAASD